MNTPQHWTSAITIDTRLAAWSRMEYASRIIGQPEDRRDADAMLSELLDAIEADLDARCPR